MEMEFDYICHLFLDEIYLVVSGFFLIFAIT